MTSQRYIAPLTSSATHLYKSASTASYAATWICPYTLRPFTSATQVRHSSKRELQTATSYRPRNLDPAPPPPRSTGVPESSIAGGILQAHDARLSRRTTQQPDPGHFEGAWRPSVSVSENEAQKSRPVADGGQTTSAQSSTSKVKRSKLRPRKAAMSLTPSAAEQLRLLLALPEPKLIRVGVKNRGCSGLAYHLEYVDKPGTFDEAVEQDGVKVLIDSRALFSIIGSEMDWVEDKLNQRFVFRNPNIKEQCGCGESFMV
ncbi:MAG: hypothetical protein LQ347_000530 [Umbilicaria vellea]|nr:MAG: hypothetical protein LQ347_000530 [Umbilicaria vellea]